jgi:hypothetical protein
VTRAHGDGQVPARPEVAGAEEPGRDDVVPVAGGEPAAAVAGPVEAPGAGVDPPPDPLERELRRMALLHRRDVRAGGARRATVTVAVRH